MKRYLSLLVCLIMIFCLLTAGCTNLNDNTGEEPDLKPSAFDIVNNLEDVSMTVKEVSTTGLTAVIKNDSKNECIYGEYYYLEKKYDGKWYEVPVAIEVNYGFEDIAYILPAEGDAEWVVDWNWLYGSLETGEYRIIKDIHKENELKNYDTYYLAAEFTI